MSVVSFFKDEKSLSLNEIEALSGAVFTGVSAETSFSSVSAVYAARAGDITFATGAKQRAELAALNGVLVFCTAELVKDVPATCFALECKNPALAFNRVARILYPDALRAPEFSGCVLNSTGAFIHPSAKLEAGVLLAPGVVIGEAVQIGSGTRIGPGAAIAAGSTIGRNCDIGANATIHCAHIGDKVIIGPGANIGHDGFGYIAGPEGLEKVPQLGRVIIQNSVEIGANSCIDRGSLDDTVIGEGTKIDNMVQIAHNVRIGRHCALAAHVGISGSVIIGDGVMLGGRAGIADHIKVGDGAMIAAASGVMSDVPAGARYGGVPAKALREYFREIATLRALAAKDTKS
jgi:UDP-3-O-[3-hydroxymyristoyl] glucosamine N-acyltransferase